MATAVLLCLAYIAGLMWASVPLGAIAPPLTPGLAAVAIALLPLIVGAIAAPTLGRRWRRGPTPTLWLVAGAIAALATLYLPWRTPGPSPQDLSHLLPRLEAMGTQPQAPGEASPTDLAEAEPVATLPLQVQVEGPLVMGDPRLNRRLRGRFFLRADQVTVVDAAGEVTFQQSTRGRVYVTAPLLQVTGLHQGQRLQVTGSLYDPPGALNPNGFDFRQYLARHGTFSGMVATTVTALEPAPWGLWWLRQRIVRSHVRALGSPYGQVVSAMALGRRAVDLPYPIQDLFTQVGLAHTVAASGFHVSLVLGVVLYGARSRSPRTQLVLGGTTLLLYLTLTGPQPSVLRAALMGAAGLAALARDRPVNPLGALLAAATLLLLLNPLWISDIGFQLSVAATFGLLVTVSPIMARLGWLPVPLAGALAVPLAATLWLLPLLLYHFNTLSWVSLGLSALTTPLVTVISLGGMISGAIALVAAPLADGLGKLLIWPVQGLLGLAAQAAALPGSTLAVGQLALWQGAALYGGLGLLWRYPPAQRRLGWVALTLVVVTLAPLGWQNLTQTRVTLLAAGGDLAWVHQQRGHTTVILDGDGQTSFYTALPFLRQAGVNHLGTAIAPRQRVDLWADWLPLQQYVPIDQFYSPAADNPWGDRPNGPRQVQTLGVGQSTATPTLTVQLLGSQNPIFRLTAAAQNWLFLPKLDLPTQDYLAQGAAAVLPSPVLVWPGEELSEALLAAVQPQVALCYGQVLPEFIERQLRDRGIQVYWTEREGAIAWTPTEGFQGYRSQRHRPQTLD